MTTKKGKGKAKANADLPALRTPCGEGMTTKSKSKIKGWELGFGFRRMGGRMVAAGSRER